MTFPTDPRERSPKGDHNRRISLGVSRNEFAIEAGVTFDQLRMYETTPPDDEFNVDTAARVGAALERLEAVREPLIRNGGLPSEAK